jgi:hypothetical protein
MASNRWDSDTFRCQFLVSLRISKSRAAPFAVTITTHYGQFAARRGKVADRPAGAGIALRRPAIGKNHEISAEWRVLFERYFRVRKGGSPTCHRRPRRVAGRALQLRYDRHDGFRAVPTGAAAT